MVNLTQIILIVVIATLTILLTYIGIQIVGILKDFRKMLIRMNKVAENVEAISNAVIRPVTGFSSLIEGIQSSLKLAELLGLVKSKTGQFAHELPARVKDAKTAVNERIREMREELDGEPTQETDATDIAPNLPKAPGRLQRFFHRAGQPLHPS